MVGFDTFEGFVGLNEKDGAPMNAAEWLMEGNLKISYLLERMIEITCSDSMVPRFKRVELVKEICV